MVEPSEAIAPIDTPQMIDTTKNEQGPAEIKRKTRELSYLDKQNILN
jgi:hypothetical protein